jgi:eukaryotic-like serine/threonine-protein kinase
MPTRPSRTLLWSMPSLARYEVLERIAVGGMAEVFRARALGAHGFEKQLAIKRILPDLARRAEFERRFIAEAKLAVTLAHANIVQVIDFGRAGPSLFIAMELIDGPNLSSLLRWHTVRDERVPLNVALFMCMEALKGLDFAHQRGVVHRDISPSNILLSRSGEVKIADFGIAKASEVETGSTQTRNVMGKWPYMSPEQTRGEELDARSDLFSMAIVAWELATGQRLFHASDPLAMVHNVCHLAIPHASSVRSDVPPALDAVLERALHRDPTPRSSTSVTSTSWSRRGSSSPTCSPAPARQVPSQSHRRAGQNRPARSPISDPVA